MSLFSDAAYQSNIEEVKKLIQEGWDINELDDEGYPLLESVDLETAKFLLTHGADVMAKDNAGFTPLHSAHTLELAQLFLDYGADVNAKNCNGITPLHCSNAPEITNLLLKYGAVFNARSCDEDTPLHTVRSEESARILLEHGGEVDARNSTGETPILCAARDGQVARVRIFILWKADINAKENEKGWTSLHFAASFGHFELAKTLLESGADPMPKDKQGKTPMDLVFGNNLFFQLLYRFGARYY